MSMATDRIQPAELEIPSRVSSAGLPVVGSAQVAASAGSSFVALSLSGAAEEAITCGPIGEGSGFVAPTLTEWAIFGHNVDLGSTEMTVIPDTSTAGDACTVQFKLVYDGDGAVIFTPSTPEQNSPHYQYGITRSSIYLGKWCDLYWRWESGSESQDYELVALAAVYIPAAGEPDFPSQG